ncbi:uncharacterized protein SPPG_00491 [Spizellomyces punctatus DAOM BR117]|uniref:SWR1-complex protein 5 n=1 Tax=Spizellomyces punctatus (strain DAOM BR117) TaxID=645134 RepID=A0A0L0HUL5_SPIPD|nr:uncharacterized protein SPPG_00491 [Spizellomyces punctatus DAOM BR117]KND04787.1 hypothetical protein SPPG_00491 [Spizellomyces punctatus DAOM BR117]|eukprot:XP_016612826.1 hypothetical protein SPPG_00491 [Spizellomyces punctatus DAOM BR117]
MSIQVGSNAIVDLQVSECLLMSSNTLRMATTITAQDLSSDSDDEDFIPTQEADASESEAESSSEEEAAFNVAGKRRGKDTLREAKRARGTESVADDELDQQSNGKLAERRSRIEALWAEMNASGGGRKVKDEGKALLVSVIEAPAQKPDETIKSSQIPPPNQPNPHHQQQQQQSSTTATPDSTLPEPTQPSRNAPRRRKSNLLALAAKYGLADAARLTVLEKSKMDWKRHVEEAGDAHSLEHHRKDGYLEKVAFLNRTDERQAELVKSMKKSRSGRR